MVKITLKPESDLVPQVREVLAQVAGRIHSLLPEAEVVHIGATSIPGSLTKGDIDIMVRVLPSEFPGAVRELQTAFPVNQPQNWNDNFASFGDDTSYKLPLGVQLVAKDSESDFFLYLRDHFIRHPEALEAYNQLKKNHADNGPEAYRSAKHIFLSDILAARPK